MAYNTWKQKSITLKKSCWYSTDYFAALQIFSQISDIYGSVVVRFGLLAFSLHPEHPPSRDGCQCTKNKRLQVPWSLNDPRLPACGSHLARLRRSSVLIIVPNKNHLLENEGVQWEVMSSGCLSANAGTKRHIHLHVLPPSLASAEGRLLRVLQAPLQILCMRAFNQGVTGVMLNQEYKGK